jgi:hypothetical protein
MQLGRFACGKMTELTIQNGFLDLGHVLNSKLVDFAWAVPWKDGARPPYTTTKTREQVLAEAKKMVAQGRQQLNQARQTVNDVDLKGATTPQDRLRQDLAQTQAQYLTARRRAGTFNPMMETWIGATEPQLVAGWGRPDGFRVDANGDRLLTYADGYTTTTTIMQGGAVVGETADVHECDITWVVRDGVTITYGWRATDFENQCRALKIGPGPHPELQF